MAAVINHEFHSQFFDLVKSSRKSIKLCSPFVKNSIVSGILEQKHYDVEISLITNINFNYFYRRSSDIEAIQNLVENSYIVTNCQNLHAKIYIFDDEVSIVTSANLTYSGLNKNFEYGIKIEEQYLNQAIVSDYNALTNTQDKSFVTKEHISSIKGILEKLPKPQKDIDFPEMDEIFHKQANEIVESLAGWKKDVFLVIDSLENDSFILREINEYIPHFKKLYPKNNNIEAKIRQQLQYLRNLGLISFDPEARGVYKKLWK